eukprot:2085790-Prymnesium_polylepis.1
MYVYRSDTIELLSKPEFTKWVDESINVFSGDFNRDVDKLELVNLVLGLWGYALLNLANADFKPLKDKVLALARYGTCCFGRSLSIRCSRDDAV